MISAAAQSTPRARLAFARASTSAAHQTRQYRYGPWQVEADPNGLGRHRTVRYRYMETLSRRLSWDNKSARPATSKPVPPYAHGMSSSSATFADTANIKSWSDDIGLGSIKPVGAVEREAVDQLLRPQQDTPNGVEKLRLPAKSVRDCAQEFAPKGTTQTVDAKRVTEATSQAPKYNDLNGYKPANFDDPNTPWELTAEEKSKHYTDLKKYRPIEWNEPDGLPAQKTEQYTDLHEYKPSRWNEPDGLPAQKAEQYKDLHEYKPSKWNEPDGLPSRTPEEQTKDYDDLHKYGAVKWNEPDGLPGMTSEEKTKLYSDLGQYGPSSFSEPDGLRPLTPEELSKNYDDLDNYAEGFKCKDALLKAQHVREMDSTPRGTPRPAKVHVEPVNYSEEYEDLDKYGPVRWNEPDGLQPPTAEELSKNYEDLHRYSQYDNSGPSSERVHPEEASKLYSDLNKYNQFPNGDPSVARIHPEEASKRYGDLAAYPRAGFEEPSVKEHVHPEELTKNYADLSSYNPRTFDAADRKYPLHPEEKTKDYKDLNSYQAILDDELSAAAQKPIRADLNEHDHAIRLKTAAHQSSAQQLEVPDAPDGTIKEAAKRRVINLEDAKKKYQTSFEAEVPKGQVSRAQPIVDIELEAMRRVEKLEDCKSEYASGWGAEEDKQPPVAEQLESVAEQRLSNLEDAKVAYELSWDAATEDAQSRVPRDQRFDKEKDDDVSSMDESFPAGNYTVQEALNELSAKQNRSKMNAAELAQAQKDPYTKTPQGLEVSYSRETGGKTTWPTAVRHHLSKANEDAEQGSPPQVVRGAGGAAAKEYVVLAFDAESQTVHIASTTSSTVGRSSDESSASLPWSSASSSSLTPAEAILRLSNPAKFFPHFRPLEAQGFEIVSGRGDVLIFARAVAGAPAYDPGTAGGKRKRSLGRKLTVGVVAAAGAAYCVGTMAEHLSTTGLI